MFRLLKIGLLFFFSFALLIVVLFQSACKKDEDEFTNEDFVDALIGEWYVKYFSRTPFYPAQTDYILITRTSDSLLYRYINTTSPYAINDPLLCTLPEIENMQYWTITGNADDLILSASDLCGHIWEFQIQYFNYRYEEKNNRIIADVELIGPDTIWILEGFYFNESYLQFSSVNDSLSVYEYVLSR